MKGNSSVLLIVVALLLVGCGGPERTPTPGPNAKYAETIPDWDPNTPLHMPEVEIVAEVTSLTFLDGTHVYVSTYQIDFNPDLWANHGWEIGGVVQDPVIDVDCTLYHYKLFWIGKCDQPISIPYSRSTHFSVMDN